MTTVEAQEDASRPAGAGSRRRLVVLVAVAVSAVAFWVYIAWRTTRFGFNPTDEGLITSESARILHGQVPHADFVSARPAGSALIHVVDVLLPTPMVITARVISLAEIALYTVLLGRLAVGRAVRSWSLAEAAGVVAAFLANLHVTPLMAWHTTDGLVLVSFGFVAVTTALSAERPRLLFLGMLALGYAAITKQGFVIGGAIALILVLAHRDRWRKNLGIALLGFAIAPAIYAVWVTTAGGLGDFFRQTLGAKRPGFLTFTSVYSGQSAHEVIVGGLLVVAAVLGSRMSRSSARRDAIAWIWVDVVARLVITGAVLHALFSQHFTDATGFYKFATWGTTVAWMLIVQLVLDGRREGRVPALLILAVGYMASLSWGYPVPNSVAGSIAFVVVWRAWIDPPRVPVRALVLGTIAAIAACAIAASTTRSVLHERDVHVYRDLPVSNLSYDLGNLSSEFAGVRTNASTYLYMKDVVDCLHQYPARYTAILPANAGLYGFLHLRNPFSTDWAWTDELVANAQDRLVADAQSLAKKGHFLVLFNTSAPEVLAYYPPPLPVGDPNAAPFFYGLPVGETIRDLLPGTRIACGSFVGVYSP
jgi:hypothetical protein